MTSSALATQMEPTFLPSPDNVEEVGVRRALLEDLALKTIYVTAPPSLVELASGMRLGYGVVDELFRRLRNDHLTEVTGMIGNAPNSLVVHPAFPVTTVAELIAYAKAHPGKVNFGSAGAGTVSHITGEYFARAAGITLVHIPYKGTGPALTDLLGGHIPMAFAPIPAAHANVSAGLLRALAVTSATRSVAKVARDDSGRSRSANPVGRPPEIRSAANVRIRTAVKTT